MKKHNTLLSILFLFLLTPFLFNIFNMESEHYFGALWDAITLIIVNVGGILLFLITFQNTKSSSKSFFIYKLIWLQEIFIVSGLFGSMMGFVNILTSMETPPPAGVDPIAVTISNTAVSILSLIYGFSGALVVYMVQKYHEIVFS